MRCSFAWIHIFFALLITAVSAHSQDGFALEVTGGAGGPVFTARNAAEFEKYCKSLDPCTINVSGSFEVGTVSVASNKTIAGSGSATTLKGNLSIMGGVRNVIVRDLQISNPMNKKGKGGGDGITIRGGKMVWIDHVTFFDCGDGCVDVTEKADRVTISWCKFYYTDQPKHRFTMLAMGVVEGKKKKKKKVKAELHITLHHNWWAENCDQRMPAAHKAEVHMYNNYFSCVGNSYCSNARSEAEILSENNFYDGVRNPCFAEDGGRIAAKGNVYRKCTGKFPEKTDDVFSPPYAYRLDDTRSVPAKVQQGAGAR